MALGTPHCRLTADFGVGPNRLRVGSKGQVVGSGAMVIVAFPGRGELSFTEDQFFAYFELEADPGPVEEVRAVVKSRGGKRGG